MNFDNRTTGLEPKDTARGKSATFSDCLGKLCGAGCRSVSQSWSRVAATQSGLVGLFVLLIASTTLAQQSVASPTPLVEQSLQIPSIAPNYEATQKNLPELTRVGIDPNQQQPISLREALKMALANNKDIEVASENVKIAEFDLKGAHGAYDPRLSSQSYYERIETPISSFLSGGSNGAVISSDYTGTFRLEGLSPKGGGNYRLDFSSLRSNTNSQFAAFNPQYPTALTFSYTQPLWRGLRIDEARRQIEIARKNLSLTDAQFRQRTIETITNVQRSYWDLVFALRNLQIQRDAVRDARTQLEHNKRMVAQGVLAPIDVVAAEAQIAGFEQSLYSAMEEVARAENSLKVLISENRQASIWTASVIPTDSVDVTAPAISLSDAMKLALDNRPELAQSNLAQEINRIDQRFFGDQTRPGVNLFGSYGMVGTAGTVTSIRNPLTGAIDDLRTRINLLSQLSGLPVLVTPPIQTIPPELIGGFGQSLDNLLLSRFNNFRVGLQIDLPLRNRTAEAQLGRSRIEGQRLTTQREQLEQGIQVDVRNALQVVQSTEARLRAAAANRAASEQQYESEKRKLDAGQSTVFLVLQRQTELTAARGNELRAQTDLNKAVADLQRATGNALTANSIVVRVR